VLRQLHSFLGRLNEPMRLGLLVIGAESERTRQAVHLWRAETLPLPREVLEDGPALSTVTNAVQAGEKTGGHLRGALREMARCSLAEGRLGSPDPDNVSRLCNSWNAEEVYWPSLEVPFHELLRKLRDEAGTDERALSEWCEAVRRAAWRAFGHAADHLNLSETDISGGSYRSRIQAERLLAGGLRQVLGERGKP
jgi:hypothetical protein